MKNMNTLWNRKDKVPVETRIQLYKTLVKPVMMYNSGTWGLTKGEENSLDGFHRKQLRIVLGVKYPRIMKNKEVYKTCNEEPLSLQILKNRWSLFGHILRFTDNIPAKHATIYYLQQSSNNKFSGRRRITLPEKLHQDIVRCQILREVYMITSLRNVNDLRNLEIIANDRKKWKNLIKMIYDAAQAEALLKEIVDAVVQD